MFDLNRRKLLLGSLITGVAIAAPALAFAEDRYQVLIQLQQDVLDTLHNCREAGRAYNFEIGYDAKKAAYTAFLHDRWNNTLTQKEVTALSNDVHGAAKYMQQTTKAEWAVRGGQPKVETLLSFILREFNRSDLNDLQVRASVRALIRGQIKIDTLDADQLRQVEDAVVGIAVVKGLLSYHLVPMETGGSPTFNEFASRYRDLIL